MANKKTSVEDLAAKAEAVKAAEPAKKAPAKKAPAKKAPAKKAAEVKEEVKAEVKEVAAKVEEKVAEVKAAVEEKVAEVKAEKAPAKKAPAKKAAPKKVETKTAVYVEFNGGQVLVDAIAAKALEVSGKKAVKELNVYYQPENNKVYFTADGEEGSFDL